LGSNLSSKSQITLPHLMYVEAHLIIIIRWVIGIGLRLSH
jgi:hypothetical protein